MGKSKYTVSTTFIASSNAERLLGENIGYDPNTKTQVDAWVIRNGDNLYPENLCSRLYTDETKSKLVGLAIKTFKKVS